MSCKICQKTYVFEDDFDSDAKPHVCSKCGFSFSLKIQLKRHTQSHANGEPFVCIYCSKDSDKMKSKSYNLRLAKKGDYCCGECGQSFNSKRLLLKHTDQEHEFESTFVCNDCDEVFPSSTELRKHSLTHKRKTVSKKRSIKKEVSVSPVAKSLECPTCHKSFTYQASLDKHIKQCESEYEVSDEEDLKPAKRKRATSDVKPSKKSKSSKAKTGKNDKKHVCNVCGKSFTRKSALEGHEIIHVKDVYDSADGQDDDEDFSESDNEKYVPKTEPKINIIKQSYMCEKCNFVCFSKANLNKHIDRNHSKRNEKENSKGSLRLVNDKEESKTNNEESKPKKEGETFKCDLCEKRFKSEKRLQKHLRLHDDPGQSDLDEISKKSDAKKKRNKDYICDICGKRFAGETCLKKHSLRHEDGSINIAKGKKKKEKPIDIFTCDFCNEEFVGKKGAYIKHINLHTPEVCGICEDRFIDRQSLREHCKIHVGTEEGRMFMECSQKALDAKNGILPPEPKVEYIYLVLR